MALYTKTPSGLQAVGSNNSGGGDVSSTTSDTLKPTGTDDTAAIQALIDAGKPVILDKGMFLAAGLVWKNNVHLFGRGPEATILKLKDGANTDLIVGQNFSSLTGGDTNGGIHDWSLNNVTLDGNLTNNTAGWCLRVYAFSYTLNNVVMRFGYSGNMLSEWGNVNTLPVGASNFGEAYLSNVKSHSSRGTGIDWRGPHDSAWANVITYENGNGNRFAVDGIKVSGAGGPLEMSQVHSWGANQRYALNVAANSVHCTGCTLEGATGGAQVKLDAHKFRMIGGEIYRNSNSRTTTTTTFTIASSTTLTLTDATAWPTFGGVYFPATGVQLAYTGKSSNQLTGVTVIRSMGQTSITTGTTVSSAGIGILVGDGTTKNYTQHKIDTQVAAVEDAVVLWGAADGGQSDIAVLPFNVQRVFPTAAQNTAVTTGLHGTTRSDAGAQLKDVAPNPKTASYTAALTDSGKAVELDSASDTTLTIPPESSVAFPTGTTIDVARLGAGAVTVVAGAGVTVRSPGGNLALRAQFSSGRLRKRATNDWVLSGDLASASGPASYPSRLRASGRNIVDENNYVLAGPGRPGSKLLGQNVMYPWAQSDWNAMAAIGMKFVRWVVFLDYWYNGANNGTINSTAVSELDTALTRMQAAGMYCQLDLHLNVARVPSWFGGDNMAALVTQGQPLVEYLYNRYGNPSSPQYTKAVVGLGVNEPPMATNVANSNAIAETAYKTIHGWHRNIGSNWIAFVSTPYAYATPIYYTALGHRGDGINADPSTYSTIGGNIVYDLHDYFLRDARTSSTTGGTVYDGRDSNGGPANGGNLIGVTQEDYVTSVENALEHKAWVRGHKEMCNTYSIPLMIGEWGWNPNQVGGGAATGEDAWIADAMAAYDDAGTAIECQWVFNVTVPGSPGDDPWSSYPSRVWRSSTLAWSVAIRS